MSSLRISHFIVIAAVAAALLAGFDGLDPSPAKARRGYGGYKKCGRGCHTRQCRATCNRARRTCVYCAKQDTKPLKEACRGQDSTCRKGVQEQIKAAVQQCKGLTGSCRGCCKADYSGACNQSFAGTSGFGSYFRKSSYGNKRYKPNCDGDEGGGGSCVAVCEKARAAALRSCKKRACDTATIDAQYQACVAACGGTTTTTLPSSARGAFLPVD